MKEIVLVQPRAGSFDMLGARLPMALLSVAAGPYQKGYNVNIIDQRTDNNWQRALKKALKGSPICVGITCMTGKQILHALQASRLVKEHSNAPVVWGGVHATLLPDETLSNPYIDMIVLREGDITFMELVEALEKNRPLEGIKGIYYKKDGKIIKNQERDFIRNLDELPELPYELVNIDDYTSLNIEGKSLDFTSSRGCPFKCSFCYNTYFNRNTWRAFSAKETVRRLKNVVKKYEIKTVYFEDDNFCHDLNRLREILQLMIKEKLDIKWGILGLRVDTAKKMDDDLFRLMEKSGCVNVDIGVESGNKRILAMIDKRITIEDALIANKKISKYPFIVKNTFIIGFPTETKEELFLTIQAALRIIKENKNAYTPFSIYTPYPGTPIYDFAVSRGFSPPKNLEEWGGFNVDNWYLHFRSWLSEREIRELQSISFTALFANKNIKYKINKPLTKFLFNLYHPIAKFRFEKNFHFLPVDSLLGRKLVE